MNRSTPTPARFRVLLGALAFALAAALAPVSVALASGSATVRVVRYHGYALRVPASWPVYRLTPGSQVCVRFNRHAVYLGLPSSVQRCPAQAVGRTEAILVEPLSAAGSVSAHVAGGPAAAASLTPATASAEPSGGSVLDLPLRAQGVRVIATWASDPAAIGRALGISSPQAAARSSVESQASAPAPIRPSAAQGGARGSAYEMPSSATQRRAVSVAFVRTAYTSGSAPGQIFTGKGFDACSAPSSAAMSAWRPYYGAVGVYIGGVNMACSQPNLTSSWVSQESASGWHLIPIYVGLQAPSNSCGCAAMSSSASTASSQGAAAAYDAITHARALGLGPGNPIYDDMEGYSRSSTNTTAVLSFLQGWTSELHAYGYLSGVYSSYLSGVQDLIANYGSGYLEPDELWFAGWDGWATTNDSNYPIPSSEWANHQRLHQYNTGGESHGGYYLSIDYDYLDSATAAYGSAAPSDPPLANTSAPVITGSAEQGQTLTASSGSWSGSPSSYAYRWDRCNPSNGSCQAVAGATSSTYTLGLADVGSRMRVLVTASNSSGSRVTAYSAPTATVAPPPGDGYWLYTGYGNIYGSLGESFYGSPWSTGVRDGSIVGMAATADDRGYWLVNSSGHVYAFGDAGSFAPVRVGHPPVIGIVRAPGGRYWLYTASGNIYGPNAPWHGSPWSSGVRGETITGMAATPDGGGYWLVDSTGHVYAFGDAKSYPQLHPAHPVIGIVATPDDRYWIYTALGNIYGPSAPWHGSPWASGVRDSQIVGMTATADGGGYWLVDSGGTVYAYGDATNMPKLSHLYPIIGIVSR